MFDFDAGKLIIIGIVALIVIGPKELPRVLRQLGQAVGKMRRMATEFQGQFMEAMREADMAEVQRLAESAKADVQKLADSAKVDVAFNPVADIKNEIKGAIDKPAPDAAALSADLAAADAEAQSSFLALPDASEIAPQEAAPAQEEAEKGRPEVSVTEDEHARQDSPPDSRKGIDAEMQALADALKAEIATAPHADAPPTEPAHAAPLRRDPTLQDNA